MAPSPAVMAVAVTVVYSPAPRQVVEKCLSLPPGTTVGDALLASGFQEQFPALAVTPVVAGIWGRKAALTQVLRPRDRVEIYRPLTVDPKVARRERFAKQGAKTTGLFAKRRDGAKAGY
jgi:putative ubiquitin-RnfH superfamily antitoxin RatB of RatAB toxin-antitoxin module